MNEKREDEVPLNWSRRAGRPARPKPATLPPPAHIPRITRLMALAIKFQGMVDRGEVRDYADIARLGFLTRARLTQIMNLMLLAPDIQAEILNLADTAAPAPRIVRTDHTPSCTDPAMGTTVAPVAEHKIPQLA